MAKGTRNIQGEMDIQTHTGTATLRVVPEDEGKGAKSEPKGEPKEEPEKPPIEAPAVAVAAKPIRIKIETETGSFWEDCPTMEAAEMRCYLVTHDGVRQRVANRIIFHAPHCVHRAIIDL